MEVLNFSVIRKDFSRMSGSRPPSEILSGPVVVVRQHKLSQPLSPLPTSKKGKVTEPGIPEFGVVTVRPKVTEISRYQYSMLAQIICDAYFLDEERKLSFKMYTFLWYIVEKLLGKKLSVFGIKDARERQTTTFALLLLRYGGRDFDTLVAHESLKLDTVLKEDSLPFFKLNEKRTVLSRLKSWNPNKFLTLKVEPVPGIPSRGTNSEPYSSYCKGYGESARNKRVKTPFSSELDGELPEEDPLFDIDENSHSFLIKRDPYLWWFLMFVQKEIIRIESVG